MSRQTPKHASKLRSPLHTSGAREAGYILQLVCVPYCHTFKNLQRQRSIRGAWGGKLLAINASGRVDGANNNFAREQSIDPSWGVRKISVWHNRGGGNCWSWKLQVVPITAYTDHSSTSSIDPNAPREARPVVKESKGLINRCITTDAGESVCGDLLCVL